MNLATKIRLIRNEMGLSQSKFATLIGCPTRSLQNWEQGIREPKATVMLKILELQPKQ